MMRIPMFRHFTRSKLLSCLLLAIAATPAMAKDPAIFQDCAKPAWPHESLEKEQTGAVTLKFFIDMDGSVSDAIVVKSSGHKLLDEAAIAGIAKCQFMAGLDREGKPRPSSMTMQYVWTLEKARDLNDINDDLAKYRDEGLKGNVDAVYKMAKTYERAGRAEDKATILKLYQAAAEHKHPAATAELARAYRNGKGVPKDQAEANRLLRRAAELGHDASQFALGEMVQLGRDGEQRDLAQAAAWFRKAAEQGHYEAQNKLGEMLFDGVGVPKDRVEAVAWYRKSAAGGFVLGQRHLAQCLQRGEGVEANFKEGVVWLRKAADQRDAEAERYLAMMHFNGIGAAADNEEAFKLLRRAARTFDGKAMLMLGDLTARGIRTPQDFPAANALYRRAAAAGWDAGMKNLGYSYETGRGIKQDYAAAMEWYMKAAALGNASAKAAIGRLYENGSGVEKNVATAIKWYKEAADRKSGDGMLLLSHIYETGNGVVKDNALAFEWLAHAVDQGNEDAARRLGVAHANGELGLPVNAELSKQWLKLADMKAEGFGLVYTIADFKRPSIK
jgi:uncharacterized protein